MKGIIVSYRRGRHTQTPDQVLVKVGGVIDVSKAHELLGKKVELNISGKTQMIGKIFATHGNNGVVRVRFKKGVPGQAIGKECEIK